MNEVSPFLARLRRGPARREPVAPTPVAADASGRWRESRPGASWPFGASVFVSLSLHAGLVAALLLWPDPRPLPEVENTEVAAFDMVFGGGSQQRPDAEEPADGMEVPPEPPSMPGVESAGEAPSTPPEPPTTDIPDAPPVPAPPPPPSAPPPPPQTAAPASVPEPPRPPEATAPPPPPPVEQALPGPPPPPPAPPRVEPPPPALAQPPATVELVPPTALRLPERFDLPLPPATPPPPPRQQARPALPGLVVPEGFQLGSRPSRPTGRNRARGLDTSIDPRFTQGREVMDGAGRVTGARVGADWNAAFRRWFMQNGHYPLEAAMRGEQGDVLFQFRATREGQVLSVRILRPSVSPTLNAHPGLVLRGAHIPAFPPDSEPVVEVEWTNRYRLIGPR